MAILSGPPERRLELTPLSYQNPEYALGATTVETPSGDWDANWLMIRINVADETRQWSASGPAFTTWELSEIAGWFRAIGERIPDVPSSSGSVEPNLQFVLHGVGDASQIQVIFALEFAPPDGKHGETVSIVFQPATNDLQRFADELEADLEGFPMRDRDPASPRAARP